MNRFDLFRIGCHRPAVRAEPESLSLGEVRSGHDQTFDPPAVCERGHDFRHIRFRHAPIKKMVRLHQNRDAGRTLVETTCGTARAWSFASPRAFSCSFNAPLHRFRSARRARSLLVSFRAPIRADKEISRSLRHSVQAGSGLSRGQDEQASTIDHSRDLPGLRRRRSAQRARLPRMRRRSQLRLAHRCRPERRARRIGGRFRLR